MNKRGLKWISCPLFGEKVAKYVLIVNDFLDGGGQASMGGDKGPMGGSPPQYLKTLVHNGHAACCYKYIIAVVD